MKFFVMAFALVLSGCTTTHTASPTAHTIPTDARGCMVADPTPEPPQHRPQHPTVPDVEVYYDKLEHFILSSAENCFRSVKYCDTFKSVVKDIPRYLMAPPESGNNDLALAIKHSNNKVVAMVAANSYYYQIRYQVILPDLSWLILQANKNDLTNEVMTITVAFDNKKYSFGAHNMASASARAFVFVGVLEKNPRLIQKGLSQIPKVLTSIRTDGSLPLESRRGSRALRYTMQVLSDIVAISYLADSQHATFHKYREPILKLATFTVNVLADSQTILPYAKENVSPGPIANPAYQDISSLRSRLAWMVLMDSLETGFLKNVQNVKLDLSSCNQSFLKHKWECTSGLRTIGEITDRPLGYTLGFNPLCVEPRNPG